MADEIIGGEVQGGGEGLHGQEAAPKGRRLASALIDLVIIPVLLGILAGIVLLAAPDPVRNVILIVVNIAWMIFRDTVYSPGRKMVGLKIVSTETGEKPTLGQAFIRNVLLIIPFVLLVGYPLEAVMVIWTGARLEDKWAKCRVVVA